MVDGGFTHPDGRALAEAIEANGETLTAITAALWLAVLAPDMEWREAAGFADARTDIGLEPLMAGAFRRRATERTGDSGPVIRVALLTNQIGWSMRMQC